MPHPYAIVALLASTSALVPRVAPRQQRRATALNILDNSQDDPIARFERENDVRGPRLGNIASTASRGDDGVGAARCENSPLAPTQGAKVFEKLVEYPCEFTIKVIGFDDETFASDMCRYIASVVDKPVDDIAFSKNDSKQKTYTSVTIKAPVASADELYQCYAVLRQDPRVKIAL